jgi:hypothetical protein
MWVNLFASVRWITITLYIRRIVLIRLTRIILLRCTVQQGRQQSLGLGRSIGSSEGRRAVGRIQGCDPPNKEQEQRSSVGWVAALSQPNKHPSLTCHSSRPCAIEPRRAAEFWRCTAELLVGKCITGICMSSISREFPISKNHEGI